MKYSANIRNIFSKSKIMNEISFLVGIYRL
jgi:hypothetical protein